MKIYNNRSDFKKRIERVFEVMDGCNISFEAAGDKIIITDEGDVAAKDGVLLDGELLTPILELPPRIEYQVGILESYVNE